MTGLSSDTLISAYATKNYGANYDGAWLHPLSPYRENENAVPTPFHPQPGGIHYRHWLGLTINRKDVSRSAVVVDAWHARRATLDEWSEEVPYIWAFGYDMDNMKARCWYEALMPLHQVRSDVPRFARNVELLVSAAELAGGYLRTALRQAWFKRPGDVSGDTSFITDDFWQASERAFYQHVHDLAQAIDNPDFTEGELDLRLQHTAQSWLHALQGDCKNLFNQWAATGYFEAEDPRRISVAHNELMQRLNGKKLRQTLALPGDRQAA